MTVARVNAKGARRWQAGHPWRCVERRIYMLQIPGGGRGFESHPHRQNFFSILQRKVSVPPAPGGRHQC